MLRASQAQCTKGITVARSQVRPHPPALAKLPILSGRYRCRMLSPFTPWNPKGTLCRVGNVGLHCLGELQSCDCTLSEQSAPQETP